MIKRLPDLFSYVVPTDNGFAPNPYGGFCTLACCAPKIRHYANVGDWIIGTTPAPVREKLLYAMRIDRGLTFDLYWNLPEYDCKKPSKNNGCGDNIYKMGTGNQLVQVRNLFHREKHIKTDTSVNRVLISKSFYYFGVNSVEIPKKFRSLVQTMQGHKRIKPTSDRYDIVTLFLEWLQTSFKQGIHGEPTNIIAKCKLPDHDCIKSS